MGLPKVLEAMLQSTLNNASLKSWNIYQDQNGDINFKLKFTVSEESVSHVQQASYTKKSSRQVQRDIERSRQWRNNSNQPSRQHDPEPQQSVTPQSEYPQHSTTQKNSASGMCTRSMSRTDPELARDHDEQLATPLNPFADSFIMPSATPDDSSTDTEQELTPTIKLMGDVDSVPCTHSKESATDETTLHDAVFSSGDNKPTRVKEKADGSSGTVRRRKDHAACSFCGRPKDSSFKKCVKCKMLVCTVCELKGCHQSHIDLYGLVDV